MKGQTAYYAIAIIAVLALGMFAVGGWPFIGSPIGFTTIALSYADFSSSSEAFNGEQFILTVLQGGMGQYATGTIYANDITSQSGERADKNFNIDIVYAEQSCNYEIKKSVSDPIYAYQVLTSQGLICDNTWATERCGSDYVAKGGDGAITCWCVRRTLQTTAVAYQTIENPEVRTTCDITVGNGIDDAVFKMDTEGNSRGWIDENVYVTYDGDLVKSYCPSQNAYYGYYVQGTWRVGLEANYEDYKIVKNSVDNALQICEDAYLGNECTISHINTVKDNLNDATADALTPSFFGSINNVAALDGAYIVNTLQNFANVPMYTFYVKADYLQIVQRVPDIQILSVSSQKFKTNGNIRVELYNYGDAGNARVWAECDSPFSSIGETEVGVDPNTMEVVWLPVTVNTAVPVCDICTVKSNDAFSTYSMDVQVCADPEQTCVPNAKECTPENKIRQCNEFGSAYTIIEDCGDGLCDYDMFGVPYCQDVPPPPPPGNYVWILIPILAGILAIIGYYAKEEIGAVIFGAIGAIVGSLIYLYAESVLVQMWLWFMQMFMGVG